MLWSLSVKRAWFVTKEAQRQYREGVAAYTGAAAAPPDPPASGGGPSSQTEEAAQVGARTAGRAWRGREMETWKCAEGSRRPTVRHRCFPVAGAGEPLP